MTAVAWVVTLAQVPSLAPELLLTVDATKNKQTNKQKTECGLDGDIK